MKNFSKIFDTNNKYKFDDKDKFISVEFQKYGYDLAVELGDMPHKALYIKLAKTTPRNMLEDARSFVKDASNARSKDRLFMWKLKELKKEKIKEPSLYFCYSIL